MEKQSTCRARHTPADGFESGVDWQCESLVALLLQSSCTWSRMIDHARTAASNASFHPLLTLPDMHTVHARRDDTGSHISRRIDERARRDAA